MSDYPKYVVQESDGEWMLDDDPEDVVIKRAERSPADRAVYRIDKATQIWLEPVTYKYQYLDKATGAWKDQFKQEMMDKMGLDSLIRQMDGAVEGLKAYPDSVADGFRIIDSTGKTIREWLKPKPVTYRWEYQNINGYWFLHETRSDPELLIERASRITNGREQRVIDSNGKVVARFERSWKLERVV